MRASPYTKRIDELYADMYNKVYDMECIGLRYFNVYGPKQNPNGSYAAVISKFISQIIHKLLSKGKVVINGIGDQSRDFTYVGDVVDANIKAMFTTNKCFEVFNIGCGNNITILMLYETIAKILECDDEPKFGPWRDGDIKKSSSNPQKACELLGWRESTDFVTGLYETIKYHKLKSKS